MYSLDWFKTFSATRDATAEHAELEAIIAHIPRPDYSRVLDVGCGVGRIAGPLAARGYVVTGVDVIHFSMATGAWAACSSRSCSLSAPC